MTTSDDARSRVFPLGLLSVRDAADMLGISRQRVCYYIRRGDLPAQSLNGHDYLLFRRDIQRFNAKRIPVGRPDESMLKALKPQREAAAKRRERMPQRERRTRRRRQVMPPDASA